MTTTSPLFAIADFLPISPTLSTSGQPTPDQFQDIQAAGFGLVVNLAMPTSENWLDHEADLVAAQGMDYYHIPVLWENPTLDDLEQLFEILDTHSDRKIWVHCAKNMRVSAMIYLYQRIRKGLSDEVARRYLQQIWDLNDTWQAFVDAALTLYQD